MVAGAAAAPRGPAVVTPVASGPRERRVRVWQGLIEAAVQVSGSGPPLVFLHGETGLLWDPFLASLAEAGTVYAPEHPGTTLGDPDAVRSLDDIHDLVVYYLELFDALGLGSLALVGHSFGAMVACEIAAVTPGRIERLVLLNPLGLWRDDAPVVNQALLEPGKVVSATLHSPEGPLGQMMTTAIAGALENVDLTLKTAWALACTGKFTWPIPDRGLRKRIHRITAPTLVLHGLSDGLVPPVYAAEFGRRIPNSRVELIPEAGHLPQLEQPERVTRAVVSFLGEGREIGEVRP